MSSYEEVASLLPSLEQDGYLIHTVNTAPLSLLLASMDPAPKANPHAKLVTEGFGEFPALENPALTYSPSPPPDLKLVERSGWGVIGDPAVDEMEDHCPEGKVADVFFDGCWREGNMPATPRGWLPGLAGYGGNSIGQGQQTLDVSDVSRSDLVGSWTLPSLKELGLDIYLEKRTYDGP